MLCATCDNPDYIIVDYASLTDEQVKCIVENATPVDKTADIVINGKYYESDDPKIEECLKDL